MGERPRLRVVSFLEAGEIFEAFVGDFAGEVEFLKFAQGLELVEAVVGDAGGEGEDSRLGEGFDVGEGFNRWCRRGG